MLGFVVGSFSISYIVSAVVCGKYLSKIGKATGLKFGMMLIVAQLYGLGALKYVDHTGAFVVLSVLAQSVGGIGAGINTTCGIAIITNFSPEEREFNIGLFEAGAGFGLLLGPLIGTALYAAGGYIAPFWFIGTICVLLIPLLQYTVSIIKKEETLEAAKKTVQHYINKVKPEDIRRDILRHRRHKSTELSPRFFSEHHPTE